MFAAMDMLSELWTGFAEDTMGSARSGKAEKELFGIFISGADEDEGGEHRSDKAEGEHTDDEDEEEYFDEAALNCSRSFSCFVVGDAERRRARLHRLANSGSDGGVAACR